MGLSVQGELLVEENLETVIEIVHRLENLGMMFTCIS